MDAALVDKPSARSRRELTKAYITVFAGFMMNFGAGCINAWGTISVYVASYYHHTDSSVNLSTMFVVYPVSCCFESASFVAGVACYHKFGPRVTAAIAGLLFTGACAGCIYLTQATAFVWAYAIAIGIGSGLASLTPIWRAWEFFPKNHGLVTGLIVLGYGLSPGVLGIIFTFLVNPTNRKADVDINRGVTEDKLFSYDIAQNVPFAFKSMAVGFAALFIVSVLLTFKPEEQPTTSKSVAELLSGREQVSPKDCPDFKTVLKSSAFWLLLIALFTGSSLGIYMTNAYKNYGLLHLKNDHELSIIGSVASGFNAAGRVILPVILDYCSFKKSYIVNSLVQIVVAGTLFLTANSPIWYGAWVSLIFLLFAGNFTGFAVETARIYGPKMGSYAFSYIGNGYALASFLSLALDQWVVPNWGYEGSFFILMGCTVIALILTIILKEQW